MKEGQGNGGKEVGRGGRERRKGRKEGKRKSGKE
jgi:hypothetical protein